MAWYHRSKQVKMPAASLMMSTRRAVAEREPVALSGIVMGSDRPILVRMQIRWSPWQSRCVIRGSEGDVPTGGAQSSATPLEAATSDGVAPGDVLEGHAQGTEPVIDWMVGAQSLVFLEDGIARRMDGATVQDIDSYRPPRQPALWPQTPSLISDWVASANPAVVTLVLSEAGKPLSPKSIQEHLVRWRLLDPDDAKDFWKRVSRKLLRDPSITRSGTGAKLYAFAETAAQASQSATTPLGRWLGDQIQVPPFYEDVAEVEREVLSQLASFCQASAQNAISGLAGHWTKRLKRTRLLLEMKPKVSDRLTLSVDQTLRTVLLQRPKLPDHVLLELLHMWQVQHQGVDPHASPRLLFALGKLREQVPISPHDLEQVGKEWTRDEWNELLAVIKSSLDDLSRDDLIWFLRHCLLHRQTAVSHALLGLLLERPRPASAEPAWRIFGQLAIRRDDANHEVAEYLSGVLSHLLDAPRNDFSSEALQQVIDGITASVQASVEASVQALQDAAQQQSSAAQLALEQARQQEDDAEHRIAQAQDAQRKAEQEVTRMATRLEEASSRGVAEAKAQAWRVVAETLESLLDRLQVDPEGVGRATSRIEGELAVAGVRPLAERGDLVPFDPKLYEWLGSGEPSLQVEVLKRPYELRHRGSAVILLRGLVRGRN